MHRRKSADSRSCCWPLGPRSLPVLVVAVVIIAGLLWPLRSTSRRKYAALYTPYDLTPGGGEKVFLTTLVTFQDLGYHTLLFIEKSNACPTIECIRSTAEKLRIYDIVWSRVKLMAGARKIDRLSSPHEVEVYMELGNGRTPRNFGLSKIHNMYVCQFPFDKDRPESLNEWKKLESFDTVVVNSAYTRNWYLRYTLPAIMNIQNYQMPSVKIISSPIGGNDHHSIVFKSLELLETKAQPHEQVNIVMLGRIFLSRQNKGYHVAIPTFRRLFEAVKGQAELHLHIVGNLQRSMDSDSSKYLSELRAMAKDLPISFHIGVSSGVLESIMRNGTIFWHMTGIDQPREGEDTASLEHFGIANLEGMSYGMIPIVLDRGGPTEVTQHGFNGFIASSAYEFISCSLRVIRMKPEERIAIRRRAILKSKGYGVNNFKENLKSSIRRGIGEAVFREFRAELRERKLTHHVPDIPSMSIKTAVVVEGRVERAFDFCVRNVMHFLGRGWALQVHHTAQNEAFVKYALRDVKGVQFVLRSEQLDNIDGYNRLLKSPQFWRALNTEKALIFQSDSIIVSSDINNFLKYDFIGAPWDLDQNNGVKEIINDPNSSNVHWLGNNGGFSIRNAKLMEQIAEKYGAGSPAEENEDVFFSRILKTWDQATLPTQEDSYRFCREVELKNMPMVTHHAALHAAWYYCGRRCNLFGDLRDELTGAIYPSQRIHKLTRSIVNYLP